MKKNKDPQRVESTRIGFGYLGKTLNMLVDHPDEAKIILALNKGDATHKQIVDLTEVPEVNVSDHLNMLVNKKCVIRKAKKFSLTETGESLANAWTAFVQTLDLNFLPPEEVEAIKEIIKK